MKKEKYICEICRKEYSCRDGLRNHQKDKHSDIFHKQIHNAVCPICGKLTDSFLGFRNHLKIHNITKENVEFFLYVEDAFNNTYKNDGVTIPKEISKDIIKYMFEYNKCEIFYHRQAVSFYKMITHIREYRLGIDTTNFIYNVLPWKLKHPGTRNSKELCELLFPEEPENSKKFYEEYMLCNNPFTGHGGELSPYSKNFCGYKDLSDEEKTKRIREAMKVDEDDRRTNQLKYWIKKGLTEKEAREMVHKRQQTFSFEKCVEKYGYEEGKKQWEKRQEKWQATLNSKSDEEKMRILKAKTENSKVNNPYSKIEHEFSSQLVDESHTNVYLTTYAIPDICVGKKIIEFYGDYYHCNPNKYSSDYYNHSTKSYAHEIWEKDRIRNERLMNDGYEVRIVWESDYKKDKEGVIADCKKYLEEV